jgi:hypothetical protein
MVELKGPAAGEGYEPSDISVRTVSLILVVFAVVAAVALGVVSWLHPFLAHRALRDVPPPSVMESQAFPTPSIRLQPEPLVDIAALHQREDAILVSYGWIDKAHGVAHIPIDQAMQSVVGHSLDATP